MSRIVTASIKHEVAYKELNELLARHAGELSAIELLAIAANLVGKIIAMQDQRVTSPAHATKTVSVNIEMGNAQAIREIQLIKGSA